MVRAYASTEKEEFQPPLTSSPCGDKSLTPPIRKAYKPREKVSHGLRDAERRDWSSDTNSLSRPSSADRIKMNSSPLTIETNNTVSSKKLSEYSTSKS